MIEAASGGVLVPDRAQVRPAQLVFLPNRGLHYEHATQRGARLDLTGHPIAARRDETRRKRAEAQAAAAADRERKQRERAAHGADAEESPIERFNREHTIEALLDRYGYLRAGTSNDWRSRYQSSKSFATRDCGEYWISLSGSDAAAGIGRATQRLPSRRRPRPVRPLRARRRPGRGVAGRLRRGRPHEGHRRGVLVAGLGPGA